MKLTDAVIGRMGRQELITHIRAQEEKLEAAHTLLTNLPDGDSPREWKEWHASLDATFPKASP